MRSSAVKAFVYFFGAELHAVVWGHIHKSPFLFFLFSKQRLGVERHDSFADETANRAHWTSFRSQLSHTQGTFLADFGSWVFGSHPVLIQPGFFILWCQLSHVMSKTFGSTDHFSSVSPGAQSCYTWQCCILENCPSMPCQVSVLFCEEVGFSFCFFRLGVQIFPVRFRLWWNEQPCGWNRTWT